MRLWNILKLWLPLAIVTTALCALVYIVVQQSLRQDANDPQIQLAEDGADALNAGQPIESIVPQTTPINLARSLAPFVMVFNNSGKVVASSAQLNGQPPSIPFGVLDNAQENGENRVTWQPADGVRIASVVVPYTANGVTGYVLAGRSLRAVEDRELQAQIYSGIVWIAALVATLVAVALGEFLFPGLAQRKPAANTN